MRKYLKLPWKRVKKKKKELDRLVWESRVTWERWWERDKNDYHRSCQVKQGRIHKVGPDYIEKKINKTEIMLARTGKQNRRLTWWKLYTKS